MTERRPHWDDELIESLPIPGHSYLEDEDIYAIIAAVEDWHEKFVMHGAFRVLAERAASAEADRDRLANQLLNEVPDSYIQMKARALTAEAAIARVRKLHKPKQHPDGMTVCAHDDYDWPCPTYNIVATERTPEDDNR